MLKLLMTFKIVNWPSPVAKKFGQIQGIRKIVEAHGDELKASLDEMRLA
jgi:hypothetical protein